MIFENTHQAIIGEETIRRVQELSRNKRRPTRTGEKFSSHFIRAVMLERGVMMPLRLLQICVTDYEPQFREAKKHLHEPFELTPELLNAVIMRKAV